MLVLAVSVAAAIVRLMTIGDRLVIVMVNLVWWCHVDDYEDDVGSSGHG